MVYKWKTGTRYTPSLAQKAGEVCSSLASEGALTPSNLVDVSRPEEAPLHKLFEWNDLVAAEEYRKSQARHMIRSIEVVNEKNPDDRKPVFYHIQIEKEEPKYETLSAIVQDVDKLTALLRDARRDMETFTSKYRSLEALSDVNEAMYKALEETEEAAS